MAPILGETNENRALINDSEKKGHTPSFSFSDSSETKGHKPSFSFSDSPITKGHKPSFSFSGAETPLISHRKVGEVPAEINPMKSYATIVHQNQIKEDVIMDEPLFFYQNDSKANSDNDDDESIVSMASITSMTSMASSIATLTTQYLGNFKNSLMIPFLDDTGARHKIISGLMALIGVGVALGLIMPKDEHLAHAWYRDFSNVLGYTYFVCWSVCFYPQVILNYRRQSTLGLSPDFAMLNFFGWSCFVAYECAMYFDTEVKRLYQERFQTSDSTVQSNDVAFAIHAHLLSIIYLFQICYYGGGLKALKLKNQTCFLLGAIMTPAVIGPMLFATNLLDHKYMLDYFYLLSLLKVSATCLKYTKQFFFNRERKSTKGWNIWYNFLECTGGSLSMIQVVLDSVDMGDWRGVTGNFAKFALGFITISFDALFFFQHYVLYAEVDELPLTEFKSEKRIEDMHLTIPESDNTVEDLSMEDSLHEYIE